MLLINETKKRNHRFTTAFDILNIKPEKGPNEYQTAQSLQDKRDRKDTAISLLGSDLDLVCFAITKQTRPSY